MANCVVMVDRSIIKKSYINLQRLDITLFLKGLEYFILLLFFNQ